MESIAVSPLTVGVSYDSEFKSCTITFKNEIVNFLFDGLRVDDYLKASVACTDGTEHITAESMIHVKDGLVKVSQMHYGRTLGGHVTTYLPASLCAGPFKTAYEILKAFHEIENPN
jgi:hypothetical protein